MSPANVNRYGQLDPTRCTLAQPSGTCEHPNRSAWIATNATTVFLNTKVFVNTVINTAGGNLQLDNCQETVAFVPSPAKLDRHALLAPVSGPVIGSSALTRSSVRSGVPALRIWLPAHIFRYITACFWLCYTSDCQVFCTVGLYTIPATCL